MPDSKWLRVSMPGLLELHQHPIDRGEADVGAIGEQRNRRPRPSCAALGLLEDLEDLIRGRSAFRPGSSVLRRWSCVQGRGGGRGNHGICRHHIEVGACGAAPSDVPDSSTDDRPSCRRGLHAGARGRAGRWPRWLHRSHGRHELANFPCPTASRDRAGNVVTTEQLAASAGHERAIRCATSWARRSPTCSMPSAGTTSSCITRQGAALNPAGVTVFFETLKSRGHQSSDLPTDASSSSRSTSVAAARGGPGARARREQIKGSAALPKAADAGPRSARRSAAGLSARAGPRMSTPDAGRFGSPLPARPGRMGRMLDRGGRGGSRTALAAAFDIAGSPAIGQDAPAFLGRPAASPSRRLAPASPRRRC